MLGKIHFGWRGPAVRDLSAPRLLALGGGLEFRSKYRNNGALVPKCCILDGFWYLKRLSWDTWLLASDDNKIPKGACTYIVCTRAAK